MRWGLGEKFGVVFSFAVVVMATESLGRRLVVGLVFPILSYGTDLFVPTKATLDKLSVFWKKVWRWTTNCFSTTPVTVLPCEACLPPLQLLLPHKRRMVALRLACSC